MGKMASLWGKIKGHKYWVVTIVFLVVVIFIDDNNLIQRYNYRCEIRDLRNQIDECREKADMISNKLDGLMSDSNYMEKIAREKFGMHSPEEEVFVIEE